MDYYEAKALFSLPSLNSLSMSLPFEDMRWRSSKIPTSGLKSLVLTQSTVSEQNLGVILQETPSLTTLAYETWIGIDDTPPPPKEP